MALDFSLPPKPQRLPASANSGPAPVASVIFTPFTLPDSSSSSGINQLQDKGKGRPGRRSESPQEALPTRTKGAAAAGGSAADRNAPMSFRVGGREGHGADGEEDVGTEGATPMDVEDGGAEEEGEYVEDGDDVEIEDDGMAAMQAMMGFGGFGTTKNKKVAGNNAGAVRKEKTTEYRQYMNRPGGFNRPLSPSR